MPAENQDSVQDKDSVVHELAVSLGKWLHDPAHSALLATAINKALTKYKIERQGILDRWRGRAEMAADETSAAALQSQLSASAAIANAAMPESESGSLVDIPAVEAAEPELLPSAAAASAIPPETTLLANKEATIAVLCNLVSGAQSAVSSIVSGTRSLSAAVVDRSMTNSELAFRKNFPDVHERNAKAAFLSLRHEPIEGNGWSIEKHINFLGYEMPMGRVSLKTRIMDEVVQTFLLDRGDPELSQKVFEEGDILAVPLRARNLFFLAVGAMDVYAAAPPAP